MKTSSHSIGRRFALLASSSLGALTMIAASGIGLAAIAPSQALAADECGPLVSDPITGETAPVTCTGNYPGGITYNADVVPLNFQGLVTVPDYGITLNATTSISLTADWASLPTLQITNSSGPAMSLTSGGNLFVPLWYLGPDSAFIGSTGISAIRAGSLALGLGEASVTGTDPNGYGVYVQADGFSFLHDEGTITSAGTGVEMHAGGAVVVVNHLIAGGDGIVVDSSGSASIFAESVTAGGDGIVAVTNNAPASVIVAGELSAGSGKAVRISSGSGGASLSLGQNVNLHTDEVEIATTGPLDLEIAGSLTTRNGATSDPLVQGTFASFSLTNTGTISGRIDLTGSSGAAYISQSGTWSTSGTSTFTDSDDTITAYVYPENGVPIIVAGANTTFDFGGGTDTFVNHGALLVQGTMTLQSLEEFPNYKYIVLGSSSGLASDGQTNDRLVADGAHFSGFAEGGVSSSIILDAQLGAVSQTNCTAAVVADCVSLVGGSTFGTTHIVLNEVGSSASALGTKVVLVDVSGGTSSAKDFVLDPGPVGYRNDELLGAGIDRGFIFYKFGYDAPNQQFGFYSVANHSAYELAPMAAEAQDVWYSTTGTWLERNTDLREALADDRGAGPAGWLKVASSKTDRHMEKDFQGDNPGFWTSYKQDTTEVIGGLDLLRAMADDQAFVAGVTLGYAKSDTNFDASPSSTSFKGMTYGAYATWLTGSLFVDGIVQVNKLDVEHKTDWIRAGDFGKGKLTSTGVQVEGGWRIPINENSAYVEPLASLAYVRTQIDDINVPDAVFNADDATSLRGSVGARVSGDALHFDATTLNIAATGRVWDEFSAKNKGKLVAGGSANLEDDFSGGFGDVALTFSLRSDTGRVSGFFYTGAKFNADYLNYENALGVRMSW